MCLYLQVVGAFTLAEIDATLTRRKVEHEKLTCTEEYGLGNESET